MTVNVVCRIQEVETRSVSVVMQNNFSLSPPECATSLFMRVVYRRYTDLARAKITRDIFGSE